MRQRHEAAPDTISRMVRRRQVLPQIYRYLSEELCLSSPLRDPVFRVLGFELAVASVRRDHLYPVLSQLLVQYVAVIGFIANKILRFGFDHVEIETELNQRDLMMVSAACEVA
jgi:hypothetical protein